MRLLILTCLVAVALARPKLPLRYPERLQNPSESSEPIPLESREEYMNGMNRRNILREKQTDEIKDTRNESTQNCVVAEPEKMESSISSSSEEQFCRLNEYNQLQLQAAHAQEQIRRMNENSHVQVPFQQLNQLAAYPYAVWYYPQIMQYVPFPPFSDISNPTAHENYEKNNVMLQW
ncbi:alpha-S1-casein isoform 2 precursor [Homo sapiens]|uniref:Isoform 4 of Alpha-S1-casein n=1 Tax=Homo sapiens TaxID=9606 RepID=P47710-4|nr:alpha-S1-casein isoform 2 precursor [Homo sapiens]|eukprot:NP_001020275.1 alpha-S1-casein isoform 2 precursor [Homo sapiens]